MWKLRNFTPLFWAFLGTFIAETTQKKQLKSPYTAINQKNSFEKNEFVFKTSVFRFLKDFCRNYNFKFDVR